MFSKTSKNNFNKKRTTFAKLFKSSVTKTRFGIIRSTLTVAAEVVLTIELSP